MVHCTCSSQDASTVQWKSFHSTVFGSEKDKNNGSPFTSGSLLRLTPVLSIFAWSISLLSFHAEIRTVPSLLHTCTTLSFSKGHTVAYGMSVSDFH